MQRLRKFIGRPIPGDWHYPVPGGPMVKGEDFDGLVRAVVSYRASNGFARGNPEAEITAYYASHFPFTVENCDEGPFEAPKNLRDLVHAWINGVWKQPFHETADPDVLKLREQACLQCPFRRALDALEGPEDHECERRVVLMARGAPGGNELGYCARHAWDNRLACLMPKDRVRKELSHDCPWDR